MNHQPDKDPGPIPPEPVSPVPFILMVGAALIPVAVLLGAFVAMLISLGVDR